MSPLFHSSLTVVLTLSLGASLVACSGGSDDPDPADSAGDGDGAGATTGDGDAGDGDGSRDPASLQSVLQDRTFLLQSAEGYEPWGTVEHVGFSEDGMGFYAGCNAHFGAASFEDDTLVVEGFGATEKGCTESQDDWFADFFSSRPTVTLNDDLLTFTNGEVTLVYLDEDSANPDRPLVGTEWTVNAFVEGQGAWGGGSDVYPTFTFNDDGTVDVSTTCNEGEGTYEVEGNTITLGGIGYSEAGCANDFGQMAEAHIQDVFRSGEITFEIEHDGIVVMRGDKGVNARVE